MNHVRKYPLFLSLFLFMLWASPAHAQIDSCWQLYCGYYHHQDCINPDSVMVDTCQTSPTFEQWYARGPFSVVFEENALPLPPVPEDSVVEVDWHAISTSATYSAIRTRFQQLEQEFGSYTLRRAYPTFDTTSFLSRLFRLDFDNYVSVTAVENFMTSTASVRIRCIVSINRMTSTPEERGIPDGVKISPNPSVSLTTVQCVSMGGSATISFLDVFGRPVRRYEQVIGSIEWDGCNEHGNHVAPGLYFCVISTGTKTTVVKVWRE